MFFLLIQYQIQSFWSLKISIFFSYCTTRTQFFDSRLDSTLLSCMFFFSSLHFILFTVHRSIVLVPLYTELWLYWAHFTLIPFDFTHRTRFSVRNTQSLSNSLSSVSMIMTVEIERMKCQSLSHLQYARILGFWKLFPPRFFLDLRSNVIIKNEFFADPFRTDHLLLWYLLNIRVNVSLMFI